MMKIKQRSSTNTKLNQEFNTQPAHFGTEMNDNRESTIMTKNNYDNTSGFGLVNYYSKEKDQFIPIDQTEPTKTLTDHDVFSNALDMSINSSKSDPMKTKILKQVYDLESKVNWQLYDSQESANVFVNELGSQNIEESTPMKTETNFDIARVYRFAE